MNITFLSPAEDEFLEAITYYNQISLWSHLSNQGRIYSYRSNHAFE